ncbi:MAG: c(7)-type cytochrome triheme domain-containing protein [Thermodesulfovibrionales bacterium]
MFIRIKGVLLAIMDFIRKYPKLSVLIALVFFAGYLFLTVEMLHFSSEPKFCQLCHPGKTTGPLSEVHTWSKNIHAARDVKCLDCHGTPGFFGYMKAKIGGLRDIYGFVVHPKENMVRILTNVSTDPKYAAEIVPNEVCLFCHTDSYNKKIRDERLMSVGIHFRELDRVVNPGFRQSMGLRDILTEPLKSDIDPNHRKHLAAKVNCMDCHLGVAHGGEFKNRANMERCVQCHEARKNQISMSDISLGTGERAVTFGHQIHTAMFKCGECHPKLFPMKKGSTKLTFADHKTDKACYACHNGRKAHFDCGRCHASVPAPKGEIAFGKGGTAVKFSHDVHTVMFKCDACHTKLFPMRKGATKITFADHGKDALCYACHNGEKASADCTRCHAKALAPKAPITYKAKDMAPVSFSHGFHAGVFPCAECHSGIWPMKRGVKKMSMDAMYQGKFCGACHNGKTAFETTQCDKCHKAQ